MFKWPLCLALVGLLALLLPVQSLTADLCYETAGRFGCQATPAPTVLINENLLCVSSVFSGPDCRGPQLPTPTPVPNLCYQTAGRFGCQ